MVGVLGLGLTAAGTYLPARELASAAHRRN
jgi:hypothetical protein